MPDCKPKSTTPGTLRDVIAAVALTAALAMPLEPQIVPKPVSLVRQKGEFTLTDKTEIKGPRNIIERTRESLSPATGFDLPETKARSPKNVLVFVQRKPKANENPGHYDLKVTSDGVQIESPSEAGLFYGLQTLRQLFPADMERKAPVAKDAVWQIPAVEIHDEPRFKWRGLMLDVARHFMPKEDVLKFIDLASFHKLSSVHIHLTDDQGWRVEIKKYPKLTQFGSHRPQTVIGHNTPNYDGQPEGGFYTQDDLREIVAYAKARYINVVPEIDMPGHMVAAIACYPELGDGKPAEVMQTWGVSKRVLNTKPETVQFCKDVLTEIMDIFPSEFIHVGGDECPKVQWENDPEEQARIKERGLKDEHELQSWFIKQMDDFLVSKGRRLIGWDEILEGGLAQNAAVMSWRGIQGGVTASQMGHDVVMSPNSYLYLDYYQGDPKTEPEAIGGNLPLEKVYSFNPVTPEIPAENAHHILGVQGNLWTEYMKDFKKVEYMAYPRACAVAEIGWTPQADRNFDDFKSRLAAHMPRLRAMDVNAHPL